MFTNIASYQIFVTGADDSRNIATVLRCMLNDGASPIWNESIVLAKDEQAKNIKEHIFYHLNTVKELPAYKFYAEFNTYVNLPLRNASCLASPTKPPL